MRLMTGAAVSLVAAAVAFGGAPDAVADEPPADTVIWSLAPASADGADQRVSLRHEVEAGDIVIDHVLLSNHAPVAADFLVYASDAAPADDGSFDVLSAGTPPTDGGAWVTFLDAQGAPSAQEVVRLEAGESRLIPIRIDVPVDATVGDHPAGVVAQLARPGAGALLMTGRTGVRVHLRVAGAVEVGLQPSIDAVRWTPSWNPFEPGTLEVTYSVENIGDVRIGMSALIRAAGPFGMLGAEARPEPLREMLRGTSVTNTVSIPLWPTFWLEGAVSVEGVAVGADDVPAVSASAEFQAWPVPWPQLTLAVGIALVLGRSFRGRRRSERTGRDQPQPVAAD